MAINNHSNNPPCVFQLIVKFDKLKTDIKKKGHIYKLKQEYIYKLEGSEVRFLRELATLLKERMHYPPPPIPDKTIFIANLDLMDREKLKMFCNDLRFLLATKYFTV